MFQLAESIFLGMLFLMKIYFRLLSCILMLVVASVRKFFFFRLTPLSHKHMMGVRILMTNICKLFLLFLLYRSLLWKKQGYLQVLCKILLKTVKIAHQITIQVKEQLQVPTSVNFSSGWVVG